MENKWKSVEKDGMPEEGRELKVKAYSRYVQNGKFVVIDGCWRYTRQNEFTTVHPDFITHYCYIDPEPDEVDERDGEIEAKLLNIARSNRGKINNIKQIALINRADINTLNSISKIEGAVIDALINKVSELKAKQAVYSGELTPEPAEDPKPLTLADCEVGMELEWIANGEILKIKEIDQYKVYFTSGTWDWHGGLHNYRIHKPEPKLEPEYDLESVTTWLDSQGYDIIEKLHWKEIRESIVNLLSIVDCKK